MELLAIISGTLAIVGWAIAIEQHRELDSERRSHNITRDRLFGCVKDGYVVPAAPLPDQPADDIISLPSELAPIWEAWEGRGQQAMKNVLKAEIAKGRSVGSLLLEYGIIPQE